MDKFGGDTNILINKKINLAVITNLKNIPLILNIYFPNEFIDRLGFNSI